MGVKYHLRTSIPLIIVGFAEKEAEVDYTMVVDHLEDEKRKLNNAKYQQDENNVVSTVYPAYNKFGYNEQYTKSRLQRVRLQR